MPKYLGAGATFGFASLSVVAKKLELELRKYQQEKTQTADYKENLESLFVSLNHAAQRPCEYTQNVANSLSLQTANIINSDTPSILIISHNASISTEICIKLKELNMTGHIISSSLDLQDMIERINLSCIVLELDSEQNSADEINLIQEVTQRFYKIPSLIVISHHYDMSVRLLAVKAGATAYFLSPVNTSELVDFIYLQCYPATTPPYRVLIVDNDEQFAHHTALILHRSETHIKSYILTQALNILEAIESFHPEIILLDLYLAECDGIELATVIRQQCIYAGIAIVFFSAETVIDLHIDAIRSQGDDFLLKSMPANHLVATVKAKVHNARTIQNLMLHDGLTGLLNRSHFFETMRRQISRSQRDQSYFSYVLLNLDHFKQINDQHGHSAGDEVLKALAELMKRHFRSVDSLFRFSGEAFVIVLADTQTEQAEPLIQVLLEKFTGLEFFSNEQSFSVTFSAGIVQFPDHPDPASLAEAAHTALYQAKESGRNCIKSIGINNEQ